MWRFIDSQQCEAAYNMALDEALAYSVMEGKSPPVLRIYGWRRPSVTLGVFQPYGDVDIDYCLEDQIPIIRRPTGGRAILHNHEITYSFSAPNQRPFDGGLMESYRLIGLAFLRAFHQLGIPVQMRRRPNTGRNLIKSPLCFNSVSLGEICWEGKKLIGSAQKRWPKGFLQQGSIPLRVDHEKAARVFGQQSHTYGTFAELWLINNNPTLEDIKKAIVRGFEEAFGIHLLQGSLSDEESAQAQRLVQQKYLSPQWNEQVGSEARKRGETSRQSLSGSCNSEVSN